MTDIAKILKDAPKNLKLYSLVHGEVKLIGIYPEREDYPIEIIIGKQGNSNDSFTKDGKIFYDFTDGECILFPSKEHKSWNEWQDILFQRGDVIVSQNETPVGLQTFLCYEKDDSGYLAYGIGGGKNYITPSYYRYATPEERDQFMAELNANGYKWNADTKQMEKSLQNTPKHNCGGYKGTITKEEPFTIDDLKPFDKVLVRDSSGVTTWQCELFQYYNNENKYQCFKSTWWQCIPYNDETKHLLGTTDDAPDKYKTW